MDLRHAMETTGITIGIVTLILSFLLFYWESNMIVGSLFAALMSGALAWLTYVVVKMLILTFKD